MTPNQALNSEVGVKKLWMTSQNQLGLKHQKICKDFKNSKCVLFFLPVARHKHFYICTMLPFRNYGSLCRQLVADIDDYISPFKCLLLCSRELLKLLIMGIHAWTKLQLLDETRGTFTIKLFLRLASMSVTVNQFHSSLIFVSKVGAYPVVEFHKLSKYWPFYLVLNFRAK